jgi:hypothetical protein
MSAPIETRVAVGKDRKQAFGGRAGGRHGPLQQPAKMFSLAVVGRQRSQGGAEFPTGGICRSLQEPASAWHRPTPVPGSADLVRCQGRRSQSG